VSSIGSLYDLLGVAPDASAADVRAAYRRAARAHHPDRHGEQAATRMAAVNAAWEVLGDPRRRAEYDRRLRDGNGSATASGGGSSAAGSSGNADRTPRSAEPAYNPLARYQDPPRFPWRFMGVMFLLGVAFVVVGIVTASDPRPAVVDNLLEPGSCVVIESNGDAAERLCTEPHDGVVSVLLVEGALCPEGTEPHRDRQGLGSVCVGPG
jgi:hypothetical protein